MNCIWICLTSCVCLAGWLASRPSCTIMLDTAYKLSNQICSYLGVGTTDFYHCISHSVTLVGGHKVFTMQNLLVPFTSKVLERKSERGKESDSSACFWNLWYCFCNCSSVPSIYSFYFNGTGFGLKNCKLEGHLFCPL